MKKRTRDSRKEYEKKRNECNSIKREAKTSSWYRICEDLEKDLEGNKKLIFHLANAYRKGTTEKALNIKDPDSNEILTVPADIDKTWTNYFAGLLNPGKEEQNTTDESSQSVIIDHFQGQFQSVVSKVIFFSNL